MDQVESESLKTQTHQLLVWFRYIDDIFSIWTHGQDKLEQFLVDLNKSILLLNLRMSLVGKMSHFQMLMSSF